MLLHPTAAGEGVRLLALDTVGSTNSEALARGRQGELGPLWITAKRQTAGRGRRGRSFASEAGNLYASLLLSDASAPERAAELSFVAAVASHDAILEVAPALCLRLKLKWPNDVLCDGAKLAGILIEGESATGRPLVTVAGIGINCAHHPGDTDYPATDLAAVGARVNPEDLFAALSLAMVRRLAQWSRGRGFAAVRASWLDRAVGLGEKVRVRLPDRMIEGRFETLDEAGRLLLGLPDGTAEVITVGDVFPLDPADMRAQSSS
jgi:BirA family biotin operon repressor/biotin-[acetyl-CoA-carboxylase] ligase